MSFRFISGLPASITQKGIKLSRSARVARTKPSLDPLSRCESGAKRREARRRLALRAESSAPAEADWSSYRRRLFVSASESTQNGWLSRRALKSRPERERDTAVDRGSATERPKLIGSRISIDGTISMLMYQFALRSRARRADRLKDESAIARRNVRPIEMEASSE